MSPLIIMYCYLHLLFLIFSLCAFAYVSSEKVSTMDICEVRRACLGLTHSGPVRPLVHDYRCRGQQKALFYNPNLFSHLNFSYDFFLFFFAIFNLELLFIALPGKVLDHICILSAAIEKYGFCLQV